MAKTKFFRVAVAGATIDGREISADHITQMAATYDPATYTARINCEHLRGYSPNPPFNAYGSVAAVKAEEVTLKIGGKDEKRLALFASFEVNDQAKDLTKADQKVFSSIEINPNFAGTGKAYLVGIAFTDSPASLGTEILKFSTRDDARKDHLIALSDGFTVEFEAEAQGSDEMRGAFAALRDFFSGMGKAQPETPPAQTATPVTPAQEQGAPSEFAAFAAQFSEGMGKMADAMEASAAKTDARFAALKQELDAMRGQIEETPSSNYSRRPTGTGGGDRVKATC